MWVLGVLGLLEQERGLRNAEHDCLDQLREAGVIR